MTTFNIFEGNMENLQKKVTRIQNKCRKYNCDFHFEVIGETFKEVKTDAGDKYNAKYYVVEAEGIAIVNGWQFVASVENTSKGNIFNKAVDVEIPERYYNIAPICEHCNVNRTRKYAYIIRNIETNEFKMVGKSCLKDFTNGMSVEAVASYEEMIHEIEEAVQPSGFAPNQYYFKLIDVIKCAYECVNKFGYVGSNGEGYRTSERVSNYLPIILGQDAYIPYKVKRHFVNEMENVDFDMNSDKADKMAHEALEWISNHTEDNNYFHNLKTVCSMDMVQFNKFGLIVSLIPSFNKNIEIKAEKEAKAEVESKSSFVGNVGDKIKFAINEDTIEVIYSWDTEWGTTYIYKIVDEKGNIFTWKTSKSIHSEMANMIREKHSKEFTISGSIKAHNDYKGVQQTELTRCRIA